MSKPRFTGPKFGRKELLAALDDLLEDAVKWAWSNRSDEGYGLYFACWAIAGRMGVILPVPNEFIDWVKEARAEYERGRAERAKAAA